MARHYPTSYSVVGHDFLEQLCRVEVRRARTKDLVWLVYRHTIGRSEGFDTGQGWKASGADIAAALGIQRANAQRIRQEAIDLGLISVGPSGEMYLGTGRTIRRNPLIELDLLRSTLYPDGSSKYPDGSTLYPDGSKKRTVRRPKEEKKLKKKEGPSMSRSEEQNESSLDRLFSSLQEGTATDRDIDTELVRLIQLEESTDRETSLRARDEREHLLNILEVMR